MGNLGAAQTILLSAVERSGKSLLRQRALGEIPQRNQDYVVAESLRRKAIRIGKTSALRQPGDYTELAKVLVQNDSAKEALKIADAIRHVFPNNAQAALGATVVESHIHQAIGNQKRSEELLEQAIRLAAAGVIPRPCCTVPARRRVISISRAAARGWGCISPPPSPACTATRIAADTSPRPTRVSRVVDALPCIYPETGC